MSEHGTMLDGTSQTDPQATIFIRKPFCDKYVVPLLLLAITAASVFVAFVADDRRDAILSAILGFVLAVGFVIYLVYIIRWRLRIENGRLFHTPIFDEPRIEPLGNISFIKEYSVTRKWRTKYYISIHFISGKAIVDIPLNYLGVQEFLELMSDKVRVRDR